MKNQGRVAEAIGLYGTNTVWKLFGTESSGERLVAALSSPNENVRTIAGMFLVQGGRKALPLLEKALKNRRNLPLVLMLIGDIDEPESEGYLRRYLNDNDPEVADAAKQVLRVLDFKHEESCRHRSP